MKNGENGNEKILVYYEQLFFWGQLESSGPDAWFFAKLLDLPREIYMKIEEISAKIYEKIAIFEKSLKITIDELLNSFFTFDEYIAETRCPSSKFPGKKQKFNLFNNY